MIEEAYSFPLERYMTRQRFERMRDFAADKESPCLIVDLDVVEARYRSLVEQLPFATMFYAVKSNPMREVIELIHELGSNFDVASRPELDLLLSLGVSASKVSYGNTIKKSRDIAYFYAKGVRLFATDSEEDLTNIAAEAPRSRVYFRIITEGTGSDWPLSRKFGAHADVIFGLIKKAKELNLEPFGVSFHVGSQQRDIGQWDDAIARCTYLFEASEVVGINLQMINIGGGFPACYIEPTQPLEVYTSEITRFLKEDFGEELPAIYVEPGRMLTADSGMIASEIVLISKKSKNNLYRWVYLDVGMFGGLIETIGEAIKFPIYFDAEGSAEEIILAGPTCDSMDILYENFRYQMPSTVRPGDRLYIFSTGAYTQSYSSVAFNGFPPLASYAMPRTAVSSSAPRVGSP